MAGCRTSRQGGLPYRSCSQAYVAGWQARSSRDSRGAVRARGQSGPGAPRRAHDSTRPAQLFARPDAAAPWSGRRARSLAVRRLRVQSRQRMSASTALPPRASIRAPASVALGNALATMPRSSVAFLARGLPAGLGRNRPSTRRMRTRGPLSSASRTQLKHRHGE